MKSTRTHFTLAVLLILTSASAVLAQEAATKTPVPVPADAAQAEATKLIKEVYGDEWAKAKTTTAKQALAKKLLGKASESKDDPASQFVLLRLARDIATQANDGQTAFQAVDSMAETFQVDTLEMKSVVLTKLASAAQKPPQHKSISEEALKLVDQAISQDNFAVADELGKLALTEARKGREKELIAQAQGRIAEVAAFAKAYEDVKAAKVALGKTPDDPDANLVVGKYLCFVKRDWDKGLPKLALGKDDALKALAKQEIEGVASASEQAKLGDGWWNLAEKQEGTVKKQLQGRAAYWYQQALPGLSGLLKDKAEKRLASCASTIQGDHPKAKLREFTATISANSERGYELGPITRNTTITLQYVRGTWKAWGQFGNQNPDGYNLERGDDCRLAIVIAPNTPSGGTVLQIVPPGTSQQPFVWRANRNYQNLILRINDSGPNWNSKPGSVEYRVRIVPITVSERAHWTDSAEIPLSGAADGSAASKPRKSVTIVGQWIWQSNALATFSADGTMRHLNNYGTWKCVDVRARKYQLLWKDGMIDLVVLSEDGNELHLQNNHGQSVTRQRKRDDNLRD